MKTRKNFGSKNRALRLETLEQRQLLNGGPWERVSIGGSGSLPRDLMDINGDGHMDSIDVSNWRENPGDLSGSWTSHSIGNSDYPNANCYRIGDISGDGLPDFVVGVGRSYDAPDRNRIYAFINPGDNGTWDRYHIGTLPDAPDGVETVGIGDMNNDGHIDILAGGECKALRWYVNPGSMQSNWSYQTLGSNFISCWWDGAADVEGMVIGHFNSDSYLDVAITTCSPNGGCGGTYMLANPASGTPSGNWTKTTLTEGSSWLGWPSSGRYSCMETLDMGDIDGDGWNDVVLADRRPYGSNASVGTTRFYWYENPGASGSWTEHQIDTLSEDALEGTRPLVTDIDLDGDVDIINYHKDDGKTYWYENNGSGTSWTKNEVYATAMSKRCAVGDVDGDGDPDMIKGGYWYVNPVKAHVGWWKLDNTGAASEAVDSSPYDNDGTIVGASWTNDGKIGKALEFELGDYVNVPEDDSLDVGDTDEITVMAWIKPTQFATDHATIVTKRSSYYTNLKTDGRLACYTYPDSGSSHYSYSNTHLSTDQWYHVAWTEDASGNRNIYINGSLDNTDTAEAGIRDRNDGLAIGRFRPTHDRRFVGTIDEVGIYNWALSEDKIYQHYLEGDTRGDWHFDNVGAANEAVDSSPYGNDGTIVGASWTDNGKIGKALEFELGDYVDVPEDDSLDVGDTDEITVMAWIKPTQFATQHATIVTKRGSYYTNLRTDGRLACYTYPDSGSSHYSYSNTHLSTDQWYHVAWTEDASGNRSIYINGNLDNTDTAEAGIRDRNDGLGIGRHHSTHNRRFVGTIDEVGIYGRALSEDEIYDLYLEGDTHGEWHFDNVGAANEAVDSSPYGNDGTIVGASWTDDGKIGKALVFDGNDYVEVLDDDSLDLGAACSFTAWVHPTSSGSTNIIFNKESSYEWAIRSGNLNWALMTAGGWEWHNTGISVPTGQWSFLALTYDSPTVTCYINGVSPVAINDPQGGNIDDTSSNLGIGARGLPGNPGSYFTGTIDEVGIYSRALTGDEIYDLFEQGEDGGDGLGGDGKGSSGGESLSSRTLAHDVVLADQAVRLDTTYAKAAWAYEFERLQARNRTDKDNSTAQAIAVDQLMCGWEQN